MEPLSPGQQAVLAALQKVDPSVTEAHFRALDPAVVQQLMGKVMMSRAPDVQFADNVPLARAKAWTKNMVMTPVNTAAGLAHFLAHPLTSTQDMANKVAGDFQTLSSVGGVSPQQAQSMNERLTARGLIQPGSGHEMRPAPAPSMGQIGRAGMGLAGDVAMLSGNPVAMGAGAAMNASDAQSAAAAFLGGYALPTALEAPGGIVRAAAKSRVASAAQEVPGGAGELATRAGQFTDPTVPNALTPQMFDLHSGLSNLLTKSMSASPAVRAYWEGILGKRAAAGTETVSEGIRTQAKTDLNPRYEAFKADETPFNTQTGGVTVREAHAAGEGSPQEAILMRALKTKWSPASLDDVIPGTQSELLQDPNVLAAAKSARMPKGFPDIAEGQPVTQGQLFTIKKVVDHMKEQAFATGAGEKAFSLKATSEALDQALRNQSDEYGAIQNEWAKRMGLADQADATLGPGIKLGGHSTGIEPTNPGWTRAIQKTAGKLGLDAWDRAVAARVSDMLATDATPADIQQFLASLPKRGTYTPKLLPRSGFVDFTKMTPGQQADFLAAMRAPHPPGFIPDIAPGPDAASVMAQQAQREGGNPFFRPTSAFEKIMPDENLSLFEQFLKKQKPKP